MGNAVLPEQWRARTDRGDGADVQLTAAGGNEGWSGR